METAVGVQTWAQYLDNSFGPSDLKIYGMHACMLFTLLAPWLEVEWKSREIMKLVFYFRID